MAVRKLLVVQQELILKKHEDMVWIICHACGGVVLQNQFEQWLSTTNRGTNTAKRLKDLLIELKLLKIKKLFRNNLLVVTKPAMRACTAGHEPCVGTKKILYSAFIIDLLIRNKLNNPSEARKFLENTTLPHYSSPLGYGILCALERYSQQIAAQCPTWDTTGIEHEKRRMAERALFQQKRQTDKISRLELDTSQPDLFSLELLNIHITGVYFTTENGTTTLHVTALYLDCVHKRTYHKNRNIVTAINTLEGVFGSLQREHKVEIHIEAISHAKENIVQQQMIVKHVAAALAKQNRLEDFSQNITFRWLDSSNRLFSHIDVANLI